MSVAAVILAAGSSRRLGRPKQTVILNGETLIERTLRTAHGAHLHPLIVVVNQQATFTGTLLHAGCTVVLNEHAAEGIASSIRAGISALSNTPQLRGAVVLTCDQIAVTSGHLCELAAMPDQVTGSAYAGRIAVPAYFPTHSFPDLLRLEGDTGARELLQQARAVATEDLALDIDTEEDLARAQRLLAPSSYSGSPEGV